MKPELEKKLFDRFEFYRPELPQTVSLLCFGLECGDGWFELIWELSEKLDILYQQEKEKISIEEQAKSLLEGNESYYLNVSQVKEKFGGLRFYIDGGTDKMQEIVYEYEEKSYSVCEKCGANGKIRKDIGWTRCLCSECHNKVLKEKNSVD